MTEKKNIIEFVDRWDCGGITSYIVNLVMRLDMSKYNVRIVCGQKDYDGYDEVLGQKRIFVETILNHKYSEAIKRTINTRRNMFSFLKKNCPDIIHLHVSNGVQLGYSKIARIVGINTIITHSHNSGQGDGSHLILKYLGHVYGKQIYQKYTDYRIACSDLAAKWVYTTKYRKKAKIIPYIVDVDKFIFSDETRNKMRAQYGLGEEMLFLTVGRMSYQKNQLFLLEVCQKLFEGLPNSKLIFIGTGELKDQIYKRAKDLRIYEKIIWIDNTRAVWKYTSMADFFILPSLFEGNPLVGIEAQASGMQCFFSASITKQAKVLENAKFIDIHLSSRQWADVIENQIAMGVNNDRRKAVEIMKKAGYNPEQQIKEIENFYDN